MEPFIIKGWRIYLYFCFAWEMFMFCYYGMAGKTGLAAMAIIAALIMIVGIVSLEIQRKNI